jgi:hypothetical protein
VIERILFSPLVPPRLSENEASDCCSELPCLFPDIAEHPSWYEALNKRFRVPVPSNFKVEENTTKYEELADKIRNFYFGTGPFSKDTWPKFADVCSQVASNVKSHYSFNVHPTNVDILSQLYSDFWFVSGITRTLRKQLAVSSVPIYLYCFAFDGKFGLLDLGLGYNRLPGKTIAFTSKVHTTNYISCPCQDFLRYSSLRIFHTGKYLLR